MSRLAALCGAMAFSLAASVASARPQDVPGAGFDQKLDACWARASEADQGGGRVWESKFAQCMGMSLSELGLDRPTRHELRCEAKAELDYALAELVGVDADAAWEDSYAACVEVGAP